MDTDHLWVLVLAGGDGIRLQAFTRLIAGAPIPKRYCRILDDRSLLETTLARVARLVPCERTLARASVNCPRSPTATRRTRRAAARSRPGPWARRSA